MKITKSSLAIILSKLKGFDIPKVRLEQYSTDSEIAAEVLWNAYMNGDIEGKSIADLGCGTGILGLGTMILGAKMVYFIDADDSGLGIAKENLKNLWNPEIPKKLGSFASQLVRERYNIGSKAVFINTDINDFKEKVDTVVQNPPFGTKEKHADKAFLEKAFSIAGVIYSLHKIESSGFIHKLSEDNGFRATSILEFDFPLKNTLRHHTKRIYKVRVGCWKIEKKDT